MMKKGLMFLLALVMLLSLGTSAFAEATFWERIDTGDIVIRKDYPSDEELALYTPHYHDFSEVQVIREPTCSEYGLMVRTCTKCGFQVQTETAKLEHDFSTGWVEKQAPTCLEEGLKYQVCSRCGYARVATIPQRSHRLGEWVVMVEATDHSAGIKGATCELCGTVVKESFDPEGTLRRGDLGTEVKAVQDLLVEQGFLGEEYADGEFGEKTEEAVRAFQEEIEMDPDGVAWPLTVKLMVHDWDKWHIVTEGDYYNPTVMERCCKDCCMKQTKEFGILLRQGDRNDNVKALQTALRELGYDVYPDGEYGDQTRRAVRDFQTDLGVEADGVAWPGIWDALFSGYWDEAIAQMEAEMEAEAAAEPEPVG